MRCQVLLSLLLTSVAFGQSDDRPACNKANRARFWPDAANTDRAVLSRATQEGTLEMCTVSGWRYRWEPVAVTWKSLMEKSVTKQARSAQPNPIADR